jgi:hypothetical protein
MARTSVLFAPLSLTLVFAPLACGASASDNETRMLDKMSSEIDKDQSDTLADPGADSGSSRAGEGSDAKHAAAPSAPGPFLRPTPTPTPRLPVVRLAPDGTEETRGQGEQAPRLSLTNANLDHPHAAHASSRRAHDARLALDPTRQHTGDASPAPTTHSPDPPAAPKQAAPQMRSPDGQLANDEEHVVPEDEDNEHIVPVDEDNEHIVGGGQR